MIKIAMVGAGNIAGAHLNAYKNVPEAEIVAICDIKESRLNAMADKYGIKNKYLSIEELRNEINDCKHKATASFVIPRINSVSKL